MDAATSRKNSTPPAWSSDLFGLIELGERQDDHLALCVHHDPPHRLGHDWRTGETWCQDLGQPNRLKRSMVSSRETLTRALSVQVTIAEAQIYRAVTDGVFDGIQRARAEQRRERGW